MKDKAQMRPDAPQSAKKSSDGDTQSLSTADDVMPPTPISETIKSLGTVQKKFFVSRKIIEIISEKVRNGTASAADLENKKRVYNELYASMSKYIKSYCKMTISSLKKSSDTLEECIQECALVFAEELGRWELSPDEIRNINIKRKKAGKGPLTIYDPTQATPTSYFKYRFYGAITSYTQKNVQNLTANDSHNLTKLNKARQYFHENGIETPSIEQYSKKTGLSVKVVKNTIKYASNSQHADIEDCLNLTSPRKSPEKQYEDHEKDSEILKSIKTALTPEEAKMFLYRTQIGYDPEEGLISTGAREKTQREVCEHFGIKSTAFSEIWNGIILKLQENSVLRDYLIHTEKSAKTNVVKEINSEPSVLLQDDSAVDEMVENLINIFSDPNFDNAAISSINEDTSIS